MDLTDLNNPPGNHLTQLSIDPQEFMGICDLSMLRNKEVPHMIKDHNLVPNQEARLGPIQQRKLQLPVWWENYFQNRDLVIIVATWTAAELTSFITQINIDSPSGEDIKVTHPGKLETGNKWTTWDVKWENYIGSMVGLSGIPLDYMTCFDIPVGWTAVNLHDRLKYQAIQIGPAWEDDKMDVCT